VALDPVVDAGWLAEHLGEEGLLVADVRGPNAHIRGHILGSIPLVLGSPNPLADRAVLEELAKEVGLRLRRLLTDRLGARVVMTRSDDTFVPLEERTGIAKRAQADFFISVHLNSAHQARATGLETYYLSREPSDGDARASAARENLVMNLEGIGPREQEGLKAILWDMAQTLHMQESSALAEILLEDLGRGLRMETRGVKRGPFVVLMTAGMPSTLVEVGFLSNPQVERRLQEETYRQQIAAALSHGVEKFAHRYQRRIGMRSPHPGPS